MSRWGPAARLVLAAVASYFLQNPQPFIQQLQYEEARRRRDSTNRSTRQRYNDAQIDRMEMVDIDPNAARTLVLGRTRVVEGVRDRWSSGTHKDKLTLVVSLAGHRIDAVEQWYLDDQAVTLDGSGYVTEAPYAVSRRDVAAEGFTLNGSGGGTFTLSQTPNGGTVRATWWLGSVTDGSGGDLTVDSVSGTSVTVSGGHANATARISYETTVTTKYVRIRLYSGTDTQSVGTDLAAEYPGEITSTDHFRGMALAVMDVQYQQDVFPTGVPRLSAVVRGARVYDPRKDSTVAGGSGTHRVADATTWEWTENPALLALHYALHANGWAVPASLVRMSDVMDAATQCDTSTDFTVRMPDNSTDVVTLARHTCGLVIPLDTDPAAAMEDVMESMGGAWAWAGGELRMRAAQMRSAVDTLDAGWLAVRDEDAGNTFATIGDRYSLNSRVNRVTGACVDREQRYQSLAFPSVADATLIAAEGERTLDIGLAGVTHQAHAQHLASIIIRETHAGLELEAACGISAWPVEVLDVLTVTLERYGFEAKTFECSGWGWSPRTGVKLRLREIASAMFTPLSELTGRDPAPNSTLPNPRDVPAVAGLAVTSGGVALDDGTRTTRTVVSWTPIQQANIAAGGYVEVQWWPAGTALPASDEWLSRREQGGSGSTTIAGLLAWQPYLFRARAVQALPYVRGAWSQHLMAVISEAEAATRWRGNLLNSGTWKVGTSGSQGFIGRGRFAAYAEGSPVDTNEIVLGTAPDGALRPLWRAVEGATGGTTAGGGWASYYEHPIDPGQMYVFDVWWKSSDGTGTNYLGVDPYTTGTPTKRVYTIPGGALEGNAYMVQAARSLFVPGRWYLARGFVLPSSYSGSQLNMSGVWDGVTGQKVYTGTDFKWNPAVGTAGHRSFQYYADQNAELLLWGPGMQLCDGTEPTLDALLAISKRGPASVVPVDWITANGLNGDFTLWADSAAHPDGWAAAFASTPVPAKEVTYTRTGPNAVRYKNTSGTYTNLGLRRAITLAVQPPAGSFFRASADLNILQNNTGSGGTPGVLVRLYTNSGLTTYRDTALMPRAYTTGWQTLAANCSVKEGELIYAVEVYCLASWTSMPVAGIGVGGSWAGDVVFDAVRLDMVQPATATEITPGAATAVATHEPADGSKSYTRAGTPGYSNAKMFAEASWTNTTNATVTVEVVTSCQWRKAASSVGTLRGYSRTSTGSSNDGVDVVQGDGDRYAGHTLISSTTDYQEHASTLTTTVSAGSTLYAAIYFLMLPTAVDDTVTGEFVRARVRITAILR